MHYKRMRRLRPEVRDRDREYNRSEKRRESNHRYAQSGRRRANEREYRSRPEVRERHRLNKRKYARSEKGRERQRAYLVSETGREKRRLALLRYEQSEKGLAYAHSERKRALRRKSERRRRRRLGGRGYQRHRVGLWLEQDGCCAVCGHSILPVPDGQNSHVDHRRPQGTYPDGTPPQIINCRHNLQVTCPSCNQRRGKRQT